MVSIILRIYQLFVFDFVVMRLLRSSSGTNLLNKTKTKSRTPGLTPLTPSLPRCYLKTTCKNAKSETLKPLCFLFALDPESFASKRIALKVDVL